MSQINTILIVDDEPLGRETVAALLQSQGYQLRFATSGPEALAQASACPPDLILLDVMLPGMDGFEVCRRLRADPHLGDVPVILLTALDDRDSRLQGIEAGADDFVSKPFDRVELRARVHTITRLNRYRRLLAERAKFEWVVEHADDGYLIVGETGRILYSNTRACLYLGIAPDGCPPCESLLELASKQYRCEPATDWSAWAAGSAEQPPAPRYLIRPACSNSETFLLQADLIEMATALDGRYLVRLRDISASVANTNLIWSFQGLVRHKLGTALAQLMGAMRLLKDLVVVSAESPGGEILAIAARGATRLQSSIQDIFRYIDVPELVKGADNRCCVAEIPSIVSEIGASLAIDAIHFEYDGVVDPTRLWLVISRHGVELILGELLENARKFHPQGSPTLDISLACVSNGLRLRVSDDGQNLSPEQLAKAWQPYYQGERFFTGQVAGMGLGLPMIAALIWRVGGSCRIYNRAASPGVSVEVVIPLAQCQ
jgi:two-component system, cell cycle response regulator